MVGVGAAGRCEDAGDGVDATTIGADEVDVIIDGRAGGGDGLLA